MARNALGQFVGSGLTKAGKGSVEWSVSPKQVAAFERTLERYRGLPLQQRMQKGTSKAGDYLARYIRQASPVGKTGNLKKSVRTRSTKAEAVGTYKSKMPGVSVGPRAPHRHLVIRGHRIVTHLGENTGRRSRANPYVDKATQGHVDEAMRIVSKALFEGGSIFGNTGLSSKTRKQFGVKR